jgi:hypothetical protein
MIIGTRMKECTFRDEPFKVMWVAWRCLCHDEEYTTSESDQGVLEEIATEYRKRHHLPEDFPLGISRRGKTDPK